MRNFLFFISGIAFLVISLYSCQPTPKADTVEKSYVFGGPAQGTSYVVKYHGAGLDDYQQSVDSILKVIDQSLSTYVENSTISKFNRQNELVTRDQHFIRMLFDSKDIRDMSDGAFDPAVMPLVKAWGFGPEGASVRENQNIDSLLQLVVWDFDVQITNQSENNSVRTTTLTVVKNKPIEFDFNGIAQGYTVDVIWEFLRDKGVKNMLIEVGGEMRAAGLSERDDPWKVGIDRPDERGERGSQAHLQLTNRSVATSGNYRKFYEKDGKRFSHTIDPQTGYPVTHQLLSTTVVASSAALADAFATVFMVYGPEKSIEFLESERGESLDAYLIYYDEGGDLKTYITGGLRNILEELPEDAAEKTAVN
jgi:thiamine biosynthesis lipoprotein